MRACTHYRQAETGKIQMNQHSEKRCERRSTRIITHHARETLYSVRTRIDYLAESVSPDATPIDIATQRRVLWNVSRDTLAVIRDLDDIRAVLSTLDALCTCSALIAEHAAQLAMEHKERGAALLALNARSLAVSIHQLQERLTLTTRGSGDAA